MKLCIGRVDALCRSLQHLSCRIGVHACQHALDPALLPAVEPTCTFHRLDLDLPDDALEALERLSAETGRSLSDVAVDLLAQAVAEYKAHQR